MKRLAVLTAFGAACAIGGSAMAQIAGGGGPIDVTADQLEMIDAQKMAIWKGNVDASQGANRLLADQLNIYFSGQASGPQAAGGGGLGKSWGDVQRMVADGKVFFMSPTQTARGQHAVYEVVPDTITITGDVAVVQGENVVRGDTLVIHVKTGNASFVSNDKGRNKPERVRAVIYSNPTEPKAGAKPAPAPAAKPAE